MPNDQRQVTTLLHDLAGVADAQSLQLAIGSAPSPLGLKAALERYDEALRRCSPFLPVPLPSVVQESIDRAQHAYAEVTGQEPLSLVQLSPAALARNPFRMCKDA
jgi:hypothetical protein